MKHAYLILAHNEFPILKLLVESIDDARNDIYIHFDKKVEVLPELTTKYAHLIILEERIDVCWGDVSIVEAELKLFEKAIENGDYSYLHLLSGVDMPLKSQDEVHDFFKAHDGKEFVGFSQYDYSKEVHRKVNLVHLFSEKFKSQSVFIKGIRAMFIRLQLLIGYSRNNNKVFKKGTQWVSITSELADYILARRGEILRIYRGTFCSDEIFIQTLCWNSLFKKNIYNLQEEGIGCQRKIGWSIDGQLHDWENKDYDLLINSNFLFARKFNTNNLDVVSMILKKTQDHS